MKKVIISVSLSLLSTSALAQQAMYIDENSLVCVTERGWDRQYSYLSQGIEKLVDGCFVTNQKLRVVLLDMELISPSQFEIVDNGQAVWVDNMDVSQE